MTTHTIPNSSPDSVKWVNTSTTFVAAARNGDVAAIIRMLVCRDESTIHPPILQMVQLSCFALRTAMVLRKQLVNSL